MSSRNSRGTCPRARVDRVGKLRDRALLARLFWFFAVGGAATLVHVAVVSTLVRWTGWQPIPANLVGWCVAFGFSYLGHRHRTFTTRDVDGLAAGRRFLVVSAAAFVANQLGYAAVLAWTPLRYDAAVLVTSLAVAAGTYVLSSRWAFRSRR